MTTPWHGPAAAELALLAWADRPMTIEAYPRPSWGLPPAQWAARMEVGTWKLVGVGESPTLAVVSLGSQLRRWLGTAAAAGVLQGRWPPPPPCHHGMSAHGDDGCIHCRCKVPGFR